MKTTNNLRVAKRKKTAPGRSVHGVVLPQPWRVHRTHGLWVEIREGYGYRNRMVADCLKPTDAEHIVNMHNTLLNAKAVQ